MMNIFDLRRDFRLKTLDEKDILSNPMAQFELWFKDAIDTNTIEPNAMALATVGADLQPSCRIVLLKKIEPKGFVFFTNYESKKGLQIAENQRCALTFMWHELERQVRIEGVIEKLSAEDSDKYFEVRPFASKLGAWASPQSSKIPDRAYLEKLVLSYENKFANTEMIRPQNWGGYVVKPNMIEFWQGRPSRLHDRIQYNWLESSWAIDRLAP